MAAIIAHIAVVGLVLGLAYYFREAQHSCSSITCWRRAFIIACFLGACRFLAVTHNYGVSWEGLYNALGALFLLYVTFLPLTWLREALCQEQ